MTNISTAFESAYFLILAQVTLIFSAVAFGVPIAILTTPSLGAIDALTTFYGIFIVASCLITAFSILIGWCSIREAIRTLPVYNVRMYAINILGFVLLFMMNNVIMFSLNRAYDMQSFASFATPKLAPVSSEVVSVTTGAIYALNSLYLLLCKMWNASYYTSTRSEGNGRYELQLSFVIGLQGICALFAFFFRGTIVSTVLMVIWMMSWLLINYSWLAKHFVDPPVPDVPADG